MPSDFFQLDDAATIRMVFQRLCRAGGEISMRVEGREWSFPIFEEVEGRIVVGITSQERTRWNMRVGDHYRMTVFDRGRKFQGTVEIADFGVQDGSECAFIEQPRVLKGRDYRGVADFVPEKLFKAVFTSPSMDFCDARIRAMGGEGVQLPLYGTGAVKEGQLKPDTPTTLELSLDLEAKFVLAAMCDSMEEGVACLRFREKPDAQVLRDYRLWLNEAMIAQDRKDRELFQSRGIRADRSAGGVKRSAPTLQVLVEKDPLVLVVGEPPFSQRLGEALGRKYGVAGLDYARGEFKGLLGPLGVEGAAWGRVRLVIVHQRLRAMSGMELASRLLKDGPLPVPLLVAGTEEDAPLKRARAQAMGAADFVVVDPFRILSVLQSVDQAYRQSS
ncbi:response regulator [Mesoterricola sediminis]|uniref:Response regulatory domain-containing protein n=1 Tax=Mesoterricola sediminis TaxID=2927980 RepID=A0AA48KEM0_9BACT|nr:response regulator [Mesoterricola sediminis]BDU75593.1 hypothetical protein METESE_05510 [Mesoterricola sediminis]